MTEGIFIQDEGTFIPTVGAAQSFTILNFVQKNSFGTGTDTLIPTPQDPTTVTGLATIFTQDFWGHNGNNIYRMSSVGIQNNSPSATLDISGTLHATSSVDFDSTLNVDRSVTFNDSLDVDCQSYFNDTTDSSSTSSGSVQISGGVGIAKKLFVGSDTKIEGKTEL